MKYSRLDLVLVSMSLFQWGGLLAWASYSEQLSLIVNLIIFIIMGLVFYFNPIVITHNFLHTAFFNSSRMNRFFTIFNSMNLGLPQILYKYHHLNHHRHNNSLEDPSSTYLFGKKGKQEHWVPYSAFSLLRDGTRQAWIQTLQKKEGHILGLEILAVIIYWLFILSLNWQFFLCAYLPLFYVGWFLAHMENYFEHFKASSPADRFGNAVSFYHPFYNRIMFNEGYHQEHHISPQDHWTLRPKTRDRYAEKMQSAGAYVAKYPPLLGMLE